MMMMTMMMMKIIIIIIGITPGHGCLSLVSGVCCQVEVFVSGRSLVQRSPTECCGSN